MSGAGQAPKPRPTKKPKIVQFATDANGTIRTVLYSDGRVFLWNWKKRPNEFDKNPFGEGYWAELSYPDLGRE
jgi:hypothetical protein